MDIYNFEIFNSIYHTYIMKYDTYTNNDKLMELKNVLF